MKMSRDLSSSLYLKSPSSSRIPRPTSARQTSAAGSASPLRPASGPSSAVKAKGVRLDLAGHIIKPSTAPESEDLTCDLVSEKEDSCLVVEKTPSQNEKQELKKQLLRELLSGDDEVTITFPKKNVAALSAPGKEIPKSKSMESLTGQSLLIGDSKANADFSFVSDGGGKDGNGRCVRNLVVARSFLNICEHVDQAQKPSERGKSCCFAGTMFLMLLMLAVTLAITVLVNYSQLVKLYNGEIQIESASWSQTWYIWIAKLLSDFKNFLLSEV